MNKQEAIRELEGMSWEHEDRYFRVRDVLELEDAIKIVNQIDDRPKVKIPQFVAEWYEKNKEGLYETIIDLIRDDERALYRQANPPTISKEDREFLEWFFREDCAFEILVNMHQFGYEIEQEIKYRVRIKDGLVIGDTLTENPITHLLTFSIGDDSDNEIFTKKELEAWGFGDVFNNSMFEVEEVE